MGTDIHLQFKHKIQNLQFNDKSSFMKLIINLSLVLSLSLLPVIVFAQQMPVRIGVVGLTHDHIHGLLGRKDQGDIVIVGIVEPNKELVERYATRYGFDKKIVYASIDEMLRKTKPEAVMAYNDIFGHLEVVEKCAPQGVHVMVEKPLAVSVDHANRMAALAKNTTFISLPTMKQPGMAAMPKPIKLQIRKRKSGRLEN